VKRLIWLVPHVPVAPASADTACAAKLRLPPVQLLNPIRLTNAIDRIAATAGRIADMAADPAKSPTRYGGNAVHKA
jgi:hypothetical protein